jgi:hypothetical protein
MPASGDDVTLLLARLRDGNQDAANQLIPRVLVELAPHGRRYLPREWPGQTLQARARKVVIDVYLPIAPDKLQSKM